MRTNILPIVALAAACCASPAAGQVAARSNGAPRHPGLAPYSAEFKLTTVKMLANGATITRESKEVSARDSESRSMSAHTSIPPSGDQTPNTSVTVSDPVAGTRITWDSRHNQARVLKFPSPDQRHGCWTSDAGNFTITYGAKSARDASGTVPAPEAMRVMQPHPAVEDLGRETIQGVEAHGHRYTTTTPVGEVGNDEPLVRTSEVWSAVDLGIAVREISDDPQSGKMTRELVNLSLTEPDPSTFQPPEGYEVLTETLHEVACPDAQKAPTPR
jgi:hypothetical protein